MDSASAPAIITSDESEPEFASDHFDLLSIDQVQERVGLKRTAIYDRMKSGTFPQSVMLGPKCSRWYKGEIVAWAKSLPRGGVSD